MDVVQAGFDGLKVTVEASIPDELAGAWPATKWPSADAEWMGGPIL
jgi:hypothetical protein